MREYESLYGDYHSDPNWTYDTLIAHIESQLKYHRNKVKYAHENWLKASMTAGQLQEYHQKKAREYEQTLEFIKLRKKEEENNASSKS